MTTNSNETAVLTALNVVFGILLSLAVELFPQFAVWWDAIPNAYKRAYRGWLGLLLALVIAVTLSVMGQLTFDLTTAAGVLTAALQIATAWIGFVFSGETTYQTAAPVLPRKQF